MNFKLANCCVRLWMVGFAGMFVSQGLFGCGPGSLPFDLATGLWGIGGLTYCFVGALYLWQDAGGADA